MYMSVLKEQKQLRQLARTKLNLQPRASIKQIVKALNSPQVTIGNFYKQMLRFQKEDEKALERQAILEEGRKRDQRIADAIQKDKEKKEQQKQNKVLKGKVKLDTDNLLNNSPIFKAQKGSVMIYVLLNGKIVLSHLIEKDDYKKMWQSFLIFSQYNSETKKMNVLEEGGGKVETFLVPVKEVKAKKQIQSFKEGSFNCVLQPIKEFIEDKIETSASKATTDRYKTKLKKVDELNKKYFDVGVNQQGLDDIAQELQIDLHVSLPFQNDNLVAKSNKKPLRTFRYINTRLNHVDYDKVSHIDNRVTLEKHELLELQRQLDKRKQYYKYRKNGDGVSEITTTDTVYGLSNDYKDAVHAFEIETGLLNCKICDIQHKDLSSFVRQGNHLNETVDGEEYQSIVKDKQSYEHIDMKRAYANYKMCSYYKGFLGKITDFRKCDKIVEIGMYRIHNLDFSQSRLSQWNSLLQIYHNYNVYPSPELDFLKSEGVTFDILEGCWGLNIDFDFNDQLLNGVDENTYMNAAGEIKQLKNRWYCKYVGQMSCKQLTKSFYMKTDKTFAEHLKAECEGHIDTFGNETRVSYDKTSNYHLSHISAFITSYMRMNVLDQLFQFKVDEIFRVVCDGIYYKPKKVQLKNCFRAEEKEIKNNVAGSSYISNPYDTDYEDGKRLEMGEFREFNRVELHLGAGGCGKTHLNLVDKGLVGICYYAPSWKLVRNKQKEYGVHASTIAKITSTDPSIFGRQNQFVNNFIVDECSMMNDKEKEILLKNCQGRVIFCGDLGFQLPPIEGEEFKPTTQMKIIKHTVNYRVSCPILSNHLTTMRAMMEKKQSILSFVKSNFKKVTELDYDYKKDMILASTHAVKDRYNETYKHLEKYYITKSDRVYGRGEIYLEKPKTNDCEIRHAYTVHSIQGETATGKLFIDLNGMYESRMLYTAISRAKKHEQIYLIY